jgi:hypothetical protein
MANEFLLKKKELSSQLWALWRRSYSSLFNAQTTTIITGINEALYLVEQK